MHTVRCSGRLQGGEGVCLGGCLTGGVYTPSPCEQNDWQTGVET